MTELLSALVPNESGEYEEWLYRKNDGRRKRTMLAKILGIKNRQEYEDFFVKMYKEGMSSHEISEWVEEKTKIYLGPRSIMRYMEKAGCLRNCKDAWQNAIKRGRVKWQLKADKKTREKVEPQVCRNLRYEIMQRDGWRCVLCGNGRKEGTLLQIDHITAKCFGGTNNKKNLRTLCIDCNIGKRIVEKEKAQGCG